MIQDRLDQIKETNESTLDHSVTLTHHDPSGFGTVPVWLHSLGMIWARTNEPASLGPW